MSSEKYMKTCGLIETTSGQGEIEVEVRVSDSELTGSVFLPFEYTKGAADVLTYSAQDPTAKTPEFRAGAAKLSKLN